MPENNPTKPDTVTELKRELAAVWRSLPDKPVFFLLLVAWLALFQFLGNSTFGYVDTPSLFKWMLNAYNAPGSEDAHGNLVPWVVLGLLWWKRREFVPLPKPGWGPGLLILVGALLMHLVGYLIQQPRISIAGFFLGIYALLGLVWGRAFIRAIVFPYILLVFCIPVGSMAETVTFPLRILASRLAVFIGGNLLQADVQRLGTQLEFGRLHLDPDHHFLFDVAPACSGIHSLFALLAITTIYGFVTFKTPWKKWAVVASAFPLAVGANVLRLLVIIVVAGNYGKQAGISVHNSTWLSLLPYVPAFALMLVIGYWLREKPAATALEGELS